jgi:uncharacterized protein
MSNKDKTLLLIKNQYQYLSSQYGIKRIGLFGSIAKGTEQVDSDIDIFVEFNQPIGFRFIEFVNDLESLLGRKVDVLTPAGLENIRNKTIADNIQKDIVYV